MKTDEKVAEILEKHCPAFWRDAAEGGSVWHHCHCKAQTPSCTESPESCDCVWHLTDTCLVGKWPQLSFLNVKKQEAESDAEKWFERAKAAISETGPTRARK